MIFRNTHVHPVAFTHADRALTAKSLSAASDFQVQEILLHYYPTGLPPGIASWGELLYILLIS